MAEVRGNEARKDDQLSESVVDAPMRPRTLAVPDEGRQRDVEAGVVRAAHGSFRIAILEYQP